jgi:hypothetical protein
LWFKETTHNKNKNPIRKISQNQTKKSLSLSLSDNLIHNRRIQNKICEKLCDTHVDYQVHKVWFLFLSYITLHVMRFSLFFWKREVKENMSEWDRVRSCWI